MTTMASGRWISAPGPVAKRKGTRPKAAMNAVSVTGVIRRFATQIDYAKVGLTTGAIIEFKPHMNKDAKAYDFVCGRDEVRDVYLVTGAALMVLIVRVADNVVLSALLHDLTQFGETKTSVILDTIDE